MGTINISWGKNKEAVNATKPEKKNKRQSSTVNDPQPDRVKMQMDKLRLALESAKDPQNPDWKDLYSLYENAMTDDEVIAQTEIATDKLEAEPFVITVDDQDNEELTKLFKSKWFTDWLCLRFNADLYGYQLAEAGQFNDLGHFKNFIAFNLKNVNRKKQQILINDYDTSGLPYAENATDLFLMELGDLKETGLLETITRMVIQKTFAETDWDRFNEKFGLPVLIIGTDAEGKELDNIEKAAKNFNQNSFLVGEIDVNNVKLLESTGTGSAFLNFDKRIEGKNKAIAKILNGQQATTEAQAWTGTAQVQQQTYVDKHTSRLRRYSNDINDKLIPFLRYHGYPIPESGVQFRFPILDDRQAMPIETEEIPDETPEEKQPQNRVAKKKGSHALVTGHSSIPILGGVRGGFLPSQKGGAGIVSKSDEEYLRRIFEKTIDKVDPAMWRLTFDALISEVTKGLGINPAKIDTKTALYKLFIDLQADTARFAAFRQFQQQIQIEALLKEGASFENFKKEASPVVDQFREYAKTEKQSAFAQAAAAERWQGFAENADIYPNLEWRTAGDSDVRDDHRKLDGLILPISDPFWKSHTPPLGWGCRCEVIQTDAPTDKKEGYEKTEAPKGFDGNPGIDRKLFSDSAGYYANTSATDAKEVNKLAKQYLDDYLNSK
jgi:SPP1 gp7 family putative phage head morphogenesis protein